MSNKTIEFISTTLGCSVSSITEDSELGITPEWDSLGQINIMIALEKEYGIEITEESITYYTTAKRVAELTG